MPIGEKKDMLEDIYTEQARLQARLFGKDTRIFEDPYYINLNMLALVNESMEALQETAWKNPRHVRYGWKRTQQISYVRFGEELIDILHFLMNLFIAAGMKPEDIHRSYMQKNQENRRRNDGKRY